MNDFLGPFVAGYGLIVMAALIPTILLGLAYPYLALRFRDAREEKPDPELGIKAGYYFMFSLALMLVVFGLTVSSLEMMDGSLDKKDKRNEVGGPQAGGPFAPPRVQAPPPKKDEGFFNPVQRIAWAIVVSGTFFSLLFLLLIKAGTNDSRYPSARRTFVGARLAVAGIIIMMTVTAGIVVMFQKKEMIPEQVSNRIYEAVIAILIVWLPTFVIHLILMMIYASRPYYVEGRLEDDDRNRDRRPQRRMYEDD